MKYEEDLVQREHSEIGNKRMKDFKGRKREMGESYIGEKDWDRREED